MTTQPEGRLAWGTIVLFGSLTIVTILGVPLFAYLYDYTWVDWTLTGILYITSGMGITVGYHRLLAHRSFECKPWVKAVLLVMGGWALQNSALLWCADHIRHHANTDQEEDPYNAMKGFWHSHVGWLFVETDHRIDKYERQLRRDPLVVWQHKYYLPIVLSGLALPFTVGALHNGWVGGLGSFLLAGLLRTTLVLNSTFSINSLCHLWGNQPHGTQDSSRDSWLVGLISFGEGYHNYHHTYARDYRNGPLWYNFDPSKWLIYSMACLGLAFNLQRRGPSLS